MVVVVGMLEGLAAHASSVSQVTNAANTNIAVAKKVLNNQKLEGLAAISLIRSADQPARAAAATGDHTGRHVNVHA